MTGAGFDVLAVGRLGVDLYPQRIGTPLAQVEQFGRYLGGTAANVAVAAARHGRRVALVSRTGADPFGEFLHTALREFGVDDRWVTPVPELPTPITFCEIFPPDTFPIWFYRYPAAPDLQLGPDEIDLDAVAAARVLWLTGTGLSAQPSRAGHHAMLAARDRRPYTVLDLDYRPTLWPDEATARREIGAAVTQVDVAVGNLAECEIAVGEAEPEAAAEALLAAGVRLAVVKQGPAGVLARTATERVQLPPLPVEVVNGLGAGDAFGGALCHGLLAGWPLADTVRFANAAGALAAGRLACSVDMPYTAEVAALLDRAAADA
ncbi:5-dehydro-2-deoxygluconokinase [Actinocatenispora thailandica]|uniref:5-dehydro-2-deoxygluconokinase n=1 Tax=Actinocatenispora thailandica TaxID=227318 RepID=A0A7R7DQP5_9ACTN|nr:5-dehydro-2-deoxygluconokinase [Actinocatenispora thailandica]BCJ35926.1 5-dehydro-2-deoxygluconokinase [Actinocatenispora thailandica]